eukprot:gene5762-11646_t
MAEKPEPVANGWKEYVDAASNLIYYHNAALGVTQWEKPISNLLNNFTNDSDKQASRYESDNNSAYSDMDEGYESDGQEVQLPLYDKAESRVIINRRVDYDTSKVRHDSTPQLALDALNKDEKDDNQNSQPPKPKKTLPPTTLNYLNEVHMYKQHRGYYRPSNPITCVLCKTNTAKHVFFPCEHVCVCPECISKDKFVSEMNLSGTPGGYCICPVCAGTIKLILTYENGAEIEKYWHWVLEVEPTLPSSFTRDFKLSEGIILSVYVNENLKEEDTTSKKSSACCIS